MNYKILFINSSQIRELISMPEAIESVRIAFRNLSSGKSVIPERIHLDTFDNMGTYLIMPSYDPEMKNTGVKTISLFKDNIRLGIPTSYALFTLFSAETGKPLAIMEGETLTALRTGAASGLATELLARKNSSSAAVFGAGNQARTQLEAVCSVRNISRVLLYNKNKERAAAFINAMSDSSKLEIIPTTDLSLLKNVDIICTATPSESPLFIDSDISEGTHINAIGSYKPNMIEISPETIRRSNLYVDSKTGCLSESGEIIQAIDNGFIDKTHIKGEIGEVLSGSIPGRISEKEITIFKTVGSAIQDLATAVKIYEAAIKNSSGTAINM